MSKRQDFMTVKELMAALQTQSEDKEVLISVHDKESKWLFDALITTVETDMFESRLAIVNVEEED